MSIGELQTAKSSESAVMETTPYRNFHVEATFRKIRAELNKENPDRGNGGRTKKKCGVFVMYKIPTANGWEPRIGNVIYTHEKDGKKYMYIEQANVPECKGLGINFLRKQDLKSKGLPYPPETKGKEFTVISATAVEDLQIVSAKDRLTVITEKETYCDASLGGVNFSSNNENDALILINIGDNKEQGNSKRQIYINPRQLKIIEISNRNGFVNQVSTDTPEYLLERNREALKGAKDGAILLLKDINEGNREKLENRAINYCFARFYHRLSKKDSGKLVTIKVDPSLNIVSGNEFNKQNKNNNLKEFPLEKLYNVSVIKNDTKLDIETADGKVYNNVSIEGRKNLLKITIIEGNNKTGKKINLEDITFVRILNQQ